MGNLFSFSVANNQDQAAWGLYGYNGAGSSHEHTWWGVEQHSMVDTNYAYVNSANAGLGGIDAGTDNVNVTSETRPKNMKLVFIIRIM